MLSKFFTVAAVAFFSTVSMARPALTGKLGVVTQEHVEETAPTLGVGLAETYKSFWFEGTVDYWKLSVDNDTASDLTLGAIGKIVPFPKAKLSPYLGLGAALHHFNYETCERVSLERKHKYCRDDGSDNTLGFDLDFGVLMGVVNKTTYVQLDVKVREPFANYPRQLLLTLGLVGLY